MNTKRTWLRLLLVLGFFAVFALYTLSENSHAQPKSQIAGTSIELLNVSYDPTRELYRDFNTAFADYWLKKTGQTVKIKQSHAGSGSQARDVIGGKAADVVTLALAYDIDAIHKQSNLLPQNWQSRLPNNSAPYTSTIVFLVRKGNPKGIKDWGDLIKPGIQVITPNPKTSGGARWNYLAIWGYVLKRELGDFSKLKDPKAAPQVAKAQAKAQAFLKELFTQDHIPVLDSGARGATNTFVQREMGDVLLAWENEAFLSIKELGPDKFDIVVPPLSILAEPSVSLVDVVAKKHGTSEVAEAYLQYLYSPVGQKLAAKHYYRPRITKDVPEELLKQFAKVELFTIEDFFGGWQKTQAEHFNDGGIYDKISKKE